MSNLFCSDHSRKAGEDLIGTATGCQTYILLECPQPWMSEAFNSKWVPENFRVMIQEVKRAKIPIKFLLICNNESHKKDQTTLLIYHRKDGLWNGYSKQEFLLPNIQQAAGVVKKWLWNQTSDCEVTTSVTRDIVVCAHGSHDQCCARYGNPFYFHANETINELGLENVRMWKSTHIGGHRFAPTAIDLPEGRYYGALEQDSFKSVLTRTGDVKCLEKIYRGWGVLPKSIQALERELIFRHGWDWFQYKVTGRIIEENIDQTRILAEITAEKPDGSLFSYQAKLIKDESQMVEVKASCNKNESLMCVKYSVDSIWLSAKKFVPLSA
ncbi:MAG: sucrase ferredoxin [Scytonematopsis contorta HA4267-MV1]|jgi:hypothetical protein|nr:sucrase ferredoxin [Scytonematopsis contorta HA4267-MV1]